jgi:hypothetical protein
MSWEDIGVFLVFGDVFLIGFEPSYPLTGAIRIRASLGGKPSFGSVSSRHAGHLMSPGSFPSCDGSVLGEPH